MTQAKASVLSKKRSPFEVLKYFELNFKAMYSLTVETDFPGRERLAVRQQVN